MKGNTRDVVRFVVILLRLNISILILSAPYAAAENAVGPDFLLVEPGARTAAMASAFVGIADDANAVIFNPAGLVNMQGSDISLTHFASFADTNYENVMYASASGAWGYGARLLVDYTSDFTQISSSGQETGAVANYDVLAQVSAGYAVAPGFSAGVSLKYFKSILMNFSKDGIAADLGVLFKFGECPDVYLGITLKNIGKQSAYESMADTLPLKFSVGAGLKHKINEYISIAAAADLDRVLINKYPPNISVGVEMCFYERFFISGGLGLKETGDGFTAGAGFMPVKNIKFSYAFQPYEDLGATHRMSLDVMY